MNSIVRVVNLKNNQSTIVRITDRGPFVGDRIIDLSAAAAKAVNVYFPGTAQVRLEVLKPRTPSKPAAAGACRSEHSNRNRRPQAEKQLLDRYPGSQVIQFQGPTGYWVRIRMPQDDKQKTRDVYEHTHVEEGGVFMVRLD